MSWNPFAPVDNYPAMLNKIATFTFFSALFWIWFLRGQFPSLDSALGPLSQPVKLGGVEVPIGMLVPAFLIALLSRVFKLHDRISDVFGIRSRFDVASILLPLASSSGGLANASAVPKLMEERDRLMSETFYKYASSSPNKAQIDPHNITMALDQWTWYWIVLEFTALMALVALALLLAGSALWAAWLFLALSGAQGLLLLIRRQCEKYAYQQVDLILRDATRRVDISGVFRAL